MDRRTDLRAIAAALFAAGVGVLLFKFAQRGDVSWWTDPAFWIGCVGLALGAGLFLWLLVPPWVTDKRARRARAEEVQLEGRANQRQGLDEIANELGQISSQLKGELRRGQRNWNLLPNTAWAKNRHLVTEEGGRRAAVESAYQQAYALSVETRIATEEELGAKETEKRQRAKESVDAAAELIDELRDAIRL
jgi:hypothetical protein